MGKTTNLNSIYRKLGYKFNDPDLLILALTHRSLSSTNNERLEFLGDSLINMIIAEALFKKFANDQEGKLSNLRSNLVKGETLTQICLELKLDEHLLLGAGEVKSGVAKRTSLLEDMLEAIVGAIYLDSNFETAKQCVLKWFAKRLEKIKITDGKDYKTRLQEYMQSKQQDLPEYSIVEITGKAHEQTFKVACKIAIFADKSFIGVAKSKKLAEQKAAREALEEIGISI